MTSKEPTLEEMAEQISDLQTQLSDMKKAYNEKKYASYNAAKEAYLAEAKALYGDRHVPLSRTYSVWWQLLYTAKQYQVARKLGQRSGLEVKLSEFLDELKVKYIYEGIKIEWEDLAYRQYTPDFVLPNGIIIETKGLFTVADRRKHICIQQQHPKLDIRFVFTSSRRKLQKGSKTTYGMWCEKNNFKYHDRIIPEGWLKERKKKPHPDFIKFSGKKIIRRYK